MEEPTRFDAVQFGKLIQSVETLTDSIDSLKSDIDSLKETRSKGFGILTGICLVAGGIGSVSHIILEKVLK